MLESGALTFVKSGPLPKIQTDRLVYTIGALVLGAALALAAPDFVDSKLFWFVGRHPHLAYDLDAQHSAEFARLARPFGPHEYVPFGYPPPLLLLLAPLALLPPLIAKVLWSSAWTAAFAWVAWRDTRWATPLLAFSIPFVICAAIGQTGLMIATLVIAGSQQLDERPRLAGALLAIAACIKPQALLLAPLVLWGRWDAVLSAVLTAAAIVLLSFLFGPGLWPAWARSIPRFAKIVDPTYYKVSPLYVLPGMWWRVTLAVAGVAFAWRQRNLCGLLVGALLCSPYVQIYDLAGLSFLGARMVREAKRAPAAVVVFGAFLVVCVAAPLLTALYCVGLMATAEWWKGTDGRRPFVLGRGLA